MKWDTDTYIFLFLGEDLSELTIISVTTGTKGQQWIMLELI